ncbi:MAG: SEC-C metal-binding domain-containing protein [Clostridia bacterium]|nr:SEC-C metal-binding domain-containing protein [Clostridia bacterium]
MPTGGYEIPGSPQRPRLCGGNCPCGSGLKYKKCCGKNQ